MKAQVIKAFLGLLILSIIISNIYVLIKTKDTLDHITWKSILYNMFYSLPPIIIVFLFCQSLYYLRDYKGTEYSIDKV